MSGSDCSCAPQGYGRGCGPGRQIVLSGANLERRVVSPFTDNLNIFHSFVREIYALWTLGESLGGCRSFALVLVDGEPQAGHPAEFARMWRRDLLQRLFRKVTYDPDWVASGDKSEHVAPLWPPWFINPWKFIKYSPVPTLLSLRQRLGARAGGGRPAAAFIYREQDRKVYTLQGELLQDALAAAGVTALCFDNKTMLEQATALRGVTTLAAVHGAALTNMIFLPAGSTVVELSFRTFWFCDPVCDPHFSGELPYTTKCGTRPPPHYHKADYHNLSHACGHAYRECPIDGGNTFSSRNPISLRNLYIDFAALGLTGAPRV